MSDLKLGRKSTYDMIFKDDCFQSRINCYNICGKHISTK